MGCIVLPGTDLKLLPRRSHGKNLEEKVRLEVVGDDDVSDIPANADVITQFLTQSLMDHRLAFSRIESLILTLAKFGQKGGVITIGKGSAPKNAAGSIVSGRTGGKDKAPSGKGIKINEGGSIGVRTRGAAAVKGKGKAKAVEISDDEDSD